MYKDLGIDIETLREEMLKGDCDAKAKMGIILVINEDNISEENIVKGYEMVKEAAREGSSIAIEFLDYFESELKKSRANLHTWTLMMKGSIAETKQDGINAVKYYKEASDKGCFQATSYLGSVYLNGVSGVSKDYAKAIECFKIAANEGIVTAQSMLGMCYSQGVGVELNFEKAEKWFKKAVEQGDEAAMICLADMYLKDQNNSMLAESLYLKVIQGQNTDIELVNNAKTSLGYLYATREDYSRAISLWRETAQAGHPHAEYALGCSYQDGFGVEKNLNMALHWFEKSFEHGNEDAEKGIKYVQGELRRNSQINKQTSKSGGCYIATAVYGTYDCPEVWTLRRFRDSILSKNIFGRVFIKTYYVVSPTLVKYFGRQRWFNIFWKRNLDNLVEYLVKRGISNHKYEDKKMI